MKSTSLFSNDDPSINNSFRVLRMEFTGENEFFDRGSHESGILLGALSNGASTTFGLRGGPEFLEVPFFRAVGPVLLFGAFGYLPVGGRVKLLHTRETGNLLQLDVSLKVGVPSSPTSRP